MGQVEPLNNRRFPAIDAGTIQAGLAHVQRSEFDFEDFFENGAVALHSVGSDGTILHANRAELELLGYTASEYVGRPIVDFHADRAVIEDVLARLARGEKLKRYPARLRAKDGTLKHVEITSSAQFRGGTFICTRCFTVDVTELNHARDEARQKDAQLRQVLEALPAAVYTTDPAGKITYYNRAAVELAGREPQLGKDEWCVTFRLYTSEGKELPHHECPMAIALKQNRPVRGVEALAQRPDGTLFPFLPFPTPIHDENGGLVGAVNMLVDISERKQAETHQRILLDELNHRVKNNLQMLYGLLRASQRETKNTEAQRVLADAAQRVGALAAAQKLLYSDSSPRSFSISGFLHAVCESAQQAFGREIAVHIDADDGQLSNDISMPLALILNELLTNAAKHGTNGSSGEISVAMKRDGDRIALSVTDAGPGFELHDTGHRSSGLGLIAGLVQQLRGTFSVERDSGARCVVRFPDDRLY
jgi:PAS domain S-box-containing protein